ncbi:MAG: hypothetical protein ACRECH_15665, partial [Nitrososphaerales archaeon]
MSRIRNLFGKRTRVILGISLVLIIAILVVISSAWLLQNNSSKNLPNTRGTLPTYTSQVNSSSSTTQTSIERRLGFWMQESDPMHVYTPLQFFNQYFQTEPYPSSLEVMVFGPLKDEQTNGSSNTQASINYWSQVAAPADKYPAIEMQFMVAYDMPNTSQLNLFQQFVNSMSHHSSVYSIGIEGEYAKGVTLQNMQQAMSIVNGVGKVFINYFVNPSVVPVGGYIIGHANFPGGDAGGGSSVCELAHFASSPYIGESVGYYSAFSFPEIGTFDSTCLAESTLGWNQNIVDVVISHALTHPVSVRQFVNLAVGFPKPTFSAFVDSNGIKTSQL